MKCPSCGAETTGKFCEFCGSEMPKEKENINITNNYYGEVPAQEMNKSTKAGACPQCGSTKINFKRERVASTSRSSSRKKYVGNGRKGQSVSQSSYRTIGLCQNCGYTWNPNAGSSNTQAKSGAPMWLWVLGWICIFPVPLTILMLRKKDMKPAVKYSIIAVAWIVYLLIGFGGSGSDSSKTETTNQPVNDTSIEVTTDSVENVDNKEIVVESKPASVNANDIDKIFLAMTPEITEEQFVSMIEQSGLSYQSKEFQGSKSIHYRVAYNESTSTFWRADSQQCIEASFTKKDRDYEDGTFEYAEMNMGFMVMDGFIYHHGTYWTIQNSLDAGYYTVADVNDRETYIKYNSAEECLSALYDGASITVDSSSSVVNDNSDSTQVADIIYELNDDINSFVIKFNEANPNEQITKDMCQPYYHHGQDHNDQIKYTVDDFEVVISGGAYSSSINFYIGYTPGDNHTNDDYKEMFRKYIKGFDLGFDDAQIDSDWNMIMDDLTHNVRFDKYEADVYMVNDNIQYMKVTKK